MNRRLLAVGFLGSIVSSSAAFGLTVKPVTLHGTIRDLTTANPDFEQFDLNNVGSLPQQFLPTFLGGLDQYNLIEPGIVQNTLGLDNTPTYQGGNNIALYPSTHGAGNFSQWYHDVPGSNESNPFSITLNPITPTSDILTYQSPALPDQDNGFYPIDNQLLGNQGQTHNNDFTVELHDTFTYEPGQSFTYIGSDDGFGFINKQLVLDAGGVHSAQTATVNLDAQAATLGLVAGQQYPLDFFYAQRNAPDSSFRIDTNIAFTGGGAAVPLPPAAWSALSLLAGLGVLGCWQARRRVRTA